MRDRTLVWGGRCALAVAVSAATLMMPAAASAQFQAPRLTGPAVGERYHIELSGSFWKPDPFGVIASEQFGIPGTQIDFVSDLGFEAKSFGDVRLVLKPGRKHKFRVQYTPIAYEADSTLSRTIVFNGQTYPVSVPIHSQFGWKVWRFGYEYDFIYRDRGSFGFLLEGRYTEYSAGIQAAFPQVDEFASAKGPLPALGLVARVYPIPNLGLTFEVSGLKLPDIDEDYKAEYFDWDIYGTFNITRNFGAQLGWRRLTTFLKIEGDQGDLRFQGLWFGGAIRF